MARTAPVASLRMAVSVVLAAMTTTPTVKTLLIPILVGGSPVPQTRAEAVATLLVHPRPRQLPPLTPPSATQLILAPATNFSGNLTTVMPVSPLWSLSVTTTACKAPSAVRWVTVGATVTVVNSYCRVYRRSQKTSLPQSHHQGHRHTTIPSRCCVTMALFMCLTKR